jgi:hypothetical protein
MKRQMRVKMSMILHMLAKESGLDQIGQEFEFSWHGEL